MYEVYLTLDKERVHQCINTITFQFVNKNCPFLSEEIFEFALHFRIDIRNNFAKLKHPPCKTNKEQKTLSYIGPSFLINISETIKKKNHLKNFKHNVKSLYLN